MSHFQSVYHTLFGNSGHFPESHLHWTRKDVGLSSGREEFGRSTILGEPVYECTGRSRNLYE